MSKITHRLVIFIIVFIFGLALSLPSFFQTERGPRINLGLDLQGGLYLLLGVDKAEALRSKVQSLASSLEYAFTKDRILTSPLELRADELGFSLRVGADKARVDELIGEIPGLGVENTGLAYRLFFTPEEVKNIESFALNQAVETIRTRLDEFGLAEPTVAKQGEDQILVELAGIKTQAEEAQAKERITKAAHLQLMEVDENFAPGRAGQARSAGALSEAEAASYGLVLMSDAKDENYKYALKAVPILDGSLLTDARVGLSDKSNYPVINFTLNAEGARKFADYTGANVGKRLAIVLDKLVYSAPSINERIGGGSGQISGSFTQEEARDVAVALRSGALLAPVKLLEQRSIGPSLGADSIKMSLAALIGSGLFIILFMWLYYGAAGIFANIALLANILVVVAVMAMFGATLTLPGMAGLVLTVGMAVDANVIINERIRELLREGVKIRAAIEQGYRNAMSAIIDSNLTSLITAIALYAYGTGTVKGFALTLGIGIVVSMITAIVGTHGLFDYFMSRIERGGNVKFWLGYSRPAAKSPAPAKPGPQRI